MGKKTKSQVNNDVRTGLLEVVDPFKDFDKDQVWKYFNSTCSYCGLSLIRANRNGHMDHLISKHGDGINHVSNRVLACGKCNEDKLEKNDWELFLKLKAPEGRYDEFKKRIEDWQSKNELSEDKRQQLIKLREIAIKEATKISIPVNEAFNLLKKEKDKCV